MKAGLISKFYYNQWAYPCVNIYDYTFLYIKLYKNYGAVQEGFFFPPNQLSFRKTEFYRYTI